MAKMHPDEVNIDIHLVRRLLTTQFPQWARLPIEPVLPLGTDNVLYRLGNKMVVRLPRRERPSQTLEKERQWLPRLAPHLPLAIPIPRAHGTPAEGYPFSWAVYGWLKGENATVNSVADLNQLATDLARFLTYLQRIDTTGGPPPGPHNFFRGAPLTTRDKGTRAAIASLGGTIKVDRGRLCAVIDFGGLGVGDPACDVMVAWKVFSSDARDVFRAGFSVDDSTWARSRGWVLSQALIALSSYTLETNRTLVVEARRWMTEILDDHISTSEEMPGRR